MISLYENIKIKRIELGMSQEDLAKKVGYKDRTSIAKIESGKVDLAQSKIAIFAEALNTTASELMGWEETPEKEEIKIETIAAHALRDLTDEEQEKILEYAKFIKAQRVKKSEKK